MANSKKDHDAPHALDAIVARVGKDNPKLLDAVLEGTSNDELVELGARILTARLVTDGKRLYGEALDFLDSATPAQKANLRGASAELLSIAVHHLAALRKKETEVSTGAQGTVAERKLAEEAARTAVTNAISLRDQAYGALRSAAGRRKERRTEIDNAFGTAEDADTLATGMEALAKLLRSWLGGKDDALKIRLDLANLDKEYAAELESSAAKVRETAAKAGKRQSSKAAQASLDREDGVQILLLGQIIRTFESANDRDATIPRLVPISARRLFNRNSTKSTSTEPAPKPVTDTPA